VYFWKRPANGKEGFSTFIVGGNRFPQEIGHRAIPAYVPGDRDCVDPLGHVSRNRNVNGFNS
jgi:hypothetical protein